MNGPNQLPPKAPRLTRQEERSAFQRWQQGDREAGDLLIKSVLPWACRCVFGLTGIQDHEELQRAAYLAAFEALQGFDPDRGRLTTYVGWQCRRTLQLVDIPGLPMRISRGMAQNAHYDQARGKSSRRGAQIDAVCDATRLDVHELTTLAGKDPSPEELAADAELRRIDLRRLRDVLSMLDRRSRRVLIWRAQGLYLHQIGERLGISRERVRQIERQALASARRFAALA